MYYNIDIRYKIGETWNKIRKVTKVRGENLKEYIDMFLTDENEIIITTYHL